MQSRVETEVNICRRKGQTLLLPGCMMGAESVSSAVELGLSFVGTLVTLSSPLVSNAFEEGGRNFSPAQLSA